MNNVLANKQKINATVLYYFTQYLRAIYINIIR